MCSAKYFSQGGSESLGVQQSVSKYIRFWCNIVNAIKHENVNQTKVILTWAFGFSPMAFGETEKQAYKSIYHTGWWRRTHDTSFEASAFEERINDAQISLPLEMEIRNLSSTIDEMKSTFSKKINEVVADVSKVLKSLVRGKSSLT